MKALARFGRPSDFGTYRMIDIPEPECGGNDIILEVKAAATCRADMEHYKVDNGSDEFDSIHGHEFTGRIARVGGNVKGWGPEQRIVSNNAGHVCGRCPACERGDYLSCPEEINLGLEYGYSGDSTRHYRAPGEIFAIHKRAIWETSGGSEYEEAAMVDPICSTYKVTAQRSSSLPGGNVVIFGAEPLGLLFVQIAKVMGALNIVVVGLEEDVKVRLGVTRQLEVTEVMNGPAEDVVQCCQEICGGSNSIGLVIDCAGVNICLRQAIEMVCCDGEIVRVGMGFKPVGLPTNSTSMKAAPTIGHMAYDATSWRNALWLLAAGRIQVRPMIAHRLGLSRWEEGFEAMANKEAIKVILTYDFD